MFHYEAAKHFFSVLPISEDAAILRVHALAVVLSTCMSDFGCGGCCSFEVHVAPRTALQEKSVVACSKQCMEMMVGDLFSISFTVLRTTLGSHCA